MDENQGFRRSSRPSITERPRSYASTSTSASSRMSPSSSNGSSANFLPNISRNASSRTAGTTSTSSGGSFLQERIQQRKDQSAKGTRRNSLEFEGVNIRDAQSSPVGKTAAQKEEKRPSSSGVSTNMRTMGVKAMEEQVTTLLKQNFDLKLEIKHRRDRQDGLEAQLEAALKQIAEQKAELQDQKELQELNDSLVKELEKRDQAVDEAVQLICGLEEKLQILEQDHEHARSLEAIHNSSYFDNVDIPSSPPSFDRNGSKLVPDRGVLRMPSFLSDTTQGTENLRSLYLPWEEQNVSDAGLPKLHEDFSDDGTETEGGDIENSPRASLSVLSESSFMSIYGNEKPIFNRHRSEDFPSQHRNNYVEQNQDPDAFTPTIPRASKRLTDRKGTYQSINDVLDSPLQKWEKFKHTLTKSQEEINKLRHATPKPHHDVRHDSERKHSYADMRGHYNESRHSGIRRTVTDYTAFDHLTSLGHPLPPTPDTIKTDTLRRLQNADGFDSTPYPRPHSAGETITSRRDGHGWDTPSEVTTDVASISSAGFYAAASIRPKRVVTPDLFSFSASDWRSNEPARDLDTPENTRARYQELRRKVSDMQYGTMPIDSISRPVVKDRQSSLTATLKVARSSPAKVPNVRVRSGSVSLGRTAPAAESNVTPKGQSMVGALLKTFRKVDTSTNGPGDQEDSAVPPPIQRRRFLGRNVSTKR